MPDEHPQHRVVRNDSQIIRRSDDDTAEEDSENDTVDDLVKLVSGANLISRREGDCIHKSAEVGKLLKQNGYLEVGAIMIAYQTDAKFGNHTCRTVRMDGTWYAVDSTFGQFSGRHEVKVLPLDDWKDSLFDQPNIGGNLITCIHQIKVKGGFSHGDMVGLLSRIKGNNSGQSGFRDDGDSYTTEDE